MDSEMARETAAAFANEFAQLGYTRGEILELFRAPFYTAVHQTWRLVGEEEIVGIIDQAVRSWRHSLPPARYRGL